MVFIRVILTIGYPFRGPVARAQREGAQKMCVCEFRMQFRLFMLGGEGGMGILFCIKLFFQFIEIFMRKCESILTFAPRAEPVSFIMLGSRGWHWNREWPFEDMLTKLIA